MLKKRLPLKDKKARKCLFVLACSAGRTANGWETHGFPIPSSTGKLEFSRPLSSSNPTRVASYKNTLTGILSLLPLVDEFRTLNWTAIKQDIEFSKIFEMFPEIVLQN
jgi:hypothetical protein